MALLSSALSDQLGSKQILEIAFASIVLFSISLATTWIYRLYFHPLAKFRGPHEAALSRRWLFEQQQAKFPERIFEELHQAYGAALRIGPNELHLTDVSLYKEIYNQTTPYLKSKSFYDGFLTAHTVFAECDPILHKERRKLLNPFFSRTGVLKLEPIIDEKIKIFLEKLGEVCPLGPIDASRAFRCLTVDVISQFAFGRSRDLIHETPGGFDAALLRAIDSGGDQLALLQHSYVTLFFAERLPLSLVARVDKTVAQIHYLHEFARDSVSQHKTRRGKSPHPVIFDNLQGLSDEYQAMEAVDILLAGSDTTAFTVATALFYILSNESIRTRLVQELKQNIPDSKAMPPLQQLENIQYLWATVKESLRLAMPVPGLLPRIVPNGPSPLTVDGQVVPPGTIIGMSAYTMHFSTDLWGPNARSFNLERWLGPEGKSLDQYLCTFSKGVWQCIGINVAHAESTMLLAHLFRKYDMKLKTKQLDVTDNFVSTYHDGVYVDFKYAPA
ncbi:uncharacterized protein A1O5_07716 [Cladophialophora psammophila CBS 110553]|uniref:Cytochrome P450 oxidoreductase n=1 Tax=Cladophialophora psammophila CBS 110553 TaxID=1182543 RepID=W9WUQ5_9EURO|nr:uncharacterized protein A1O5_07716 [Cladophialophora psammophila CBS 110553]EXJ68785.1 hypothetical protein A1O5_07716 [Cladophialophora psammophila CBS 110553]